MKVLQPLLMHYLKFKKKKIKTKKRIISIEVI